MPRETVIAGYDYGTERAGRSPVTLDELRHLEAASRLTAEDERWERRAGAILTPTCTQLRKPS